MRLTQRLTPPVIAAGLCLLFLALSARWLAVDQRVPDFDSSKHLLFSFEFADALRGHDWLGPFNLFTAYPPLPHTIGALGALIGGDSVWAPVFAVNLVFVPLLVLSVYRTGALLANDWIALLAVAFTLGAPLLTTMFHGFFLETPVTALVAATIWMAIESRRFERTVPTVLCGVAAGLGLLCKQPFAFFVAGFLLVMLLRGAWRRWRGIALAAAAVLVVAGPWYLRHLSDLPGSLEYAKAKPDPPRWSSSNFTWFGWVEVNDLLFAPLFAVALAGALASSLNWLRERRTDDWTPELLASVVVGYVGLTFGMNVHAPYYALPLLPAEALLATIWLARVRRPVVVRAVAAAVALIAVVNVLAINFVGGRPRGVRLGSQTNTQQAAHFFTVYSSRAWTSGPPVGDGPVPAIMRASRRKGIRSMEFDAGVDRYDFNPTGLRMLAVADGIADAPGYDPGGLGPRTAFWTVRAVSAEWPRPCGRLEDGSGVFLILGPATRPGADYSWCPTRAR
jgi:4-amino-4-deoxy-L-arabinose transferase-like glycosyltransferase